MKPSNWLLGAILACNAAGASDAAPVNGGLYIRGAFNGWGTDNALVHKGNGIYEADVLVGPGNHGFKVASKDWATEWVIDPAASVSVRPDAAYKMEPRPGPGEFLFARHTGTWRFTLDASDPRAPVLRVAGVETKDAAPAADPHAGHKHVAQLRFGTWDGNQETATFSVDDANATLRTYAHSTTMQLRDPGPQHVRYQESASLPYVRSGNLAFDALFALAASEMRQDSVREIRDGNYNGGEPIACECFETGEKWHYVWTRDLSYAADLGLAMLDPLRVQASLEFKLSGFRPGMRKAAQVAGTTDGLQVAQDTGSGGSWPVSTDRVTWAFAAEEVLKNLPAAERAPFAERALKALSNTIENDRLAAFDRNTGLYNGEQSFLDWREQSYGSWIPDDLSSMASSRALSTNVAHYKALNVAAQLAAERGDTERGRRYAQWASDLKAAINKRLWLDDAGMYSSLTAGHFDGAPMRKFDWLGQALAIVTGVASPGQAQRIVASYPHGPMGAPVIWPQQQGVPVYHNRAIWPFVTAYGLKAATQTGNVSVADAAYDTLMRGAALNLSNMENLEWLSGQPLLLDERNPSLIGPVINSRRQLWSVGAYLGMVIENVFGVTVSPDGIALRPFVTAKLRRETFGAANEIVLRNLTLRGKRITVRLRLPPAAQGDGYYQVAGIELNGKAADKAVRWDRLQDDNNIDITLGALVPGQQAIRRVSADPYVEDSAVFGPREPVIEALARDADGRPRLTIAPGGDGGGVAYNVYRDGKLVAAGVAPGAWTDRTASATACYAVEAEHPGSGNRSHHSPPRCVDAGIEVTTLDPRVASNIAPAGPNERFTQPRLPGWGKPGDSFAVNGVRVEHAGEYALQVRYHNGANQVNLGISGGVKWLAVKDAAGRIVAQGVVQLPHARIGKTVSAPVYSTPLLARLKPGSYSLQMSDFYNMSYLASNRSFSAAGGVDGPANRFDIFGVRLLRVR